MNIKYMSPKRTNVLSYHTAHEWFFYDPETGLLHWKMRPGKRSSVMWGDVAGSELSTGYRRIRLKGKDYRAHNIIWVMHHGDIPSDKTVDHKDNNRSNNRLENLRLANRRQQGINRCMNGFYWHKGNSKWYAKHRIGGKREHIGYFPTALQARLAYERHVKELEPEFANTSWTEAIESLCSGGFHTTWRPATA